MLFEFDAVVLFSIILACVRLGVVFYLTPLDGLGRVPKRFTLLFLLGFSAVIISSVGIRIPPSDLSIGFIAFSAIMELVNGLILVLGVYVVFSALMIAGQLIDAQTGFAAAAVLNPATNNQEPIMGVLLQLLGVVLFFTMGMHHLFIEGLVYSFELVPLGTVIEVDNWREIFSQFGVMFAFGVVLAAPVLTGILLLDVGIGMMSRTMPQMNIYFVTLPLKIFLGLVLLTFSLRYLIPLIETMFNGIFVYWAALLSQ